MTGHPDCLRSPLIILGGMGAIILVACSPTAGQATTAGPGLSATTITVTVTDAITVTVTADNSVPITNVFDQSQLEQGVTDELTGLPPKGYGLSGITNVRCPVNQPVKADTSFQCTLAVNGTAKTVTIVVKDDTGLYEVNPPN
jgi:hypothetical protein